MMSQVAEVVLQFPMAHPHMLIQVINNGKDIDVFDRQLLWDLTQVKLLLQSEISGDLSHRLNTSK